MTLTGSSASPFAAIESAVYKTLFAGYSPYAALTGEVPQGRANATKESSKNRAAGASGPSPPVAGQTLKAKDESGSPEPGSCKKTD